MAIDAHPPNKMSNVGALQSNNRNIDSQGDANTDIGAKAHISI